MMFGYLRPWGELVSDAIVAVGETLLARHDKRRGIVVNNYAGRMECDGPDAAEVTWATSAAAGVAPRPAPGDFRTPGAGITWAGWAIPAILEVLAEHRFYAQNRGGESLLKTYSYSCVAPMGGLCTSFECRGYPGALDEWAEHIASLIADRISCDPAKAIEALRNLSTSEARAADAARHASAVFPQHTK